MDAADNLPMPKRSAVWRVATIMSPSNVRYAPPILLLSEDGGSTIRNKQIGYRGQSGLGGFTLQDPACRGRRFTLVAKARSRDL